MTENYLQLGIEKLIKEQLLGMKEELYSELLREIEKVKHDKKYVSVSEYAKLMKLTKQAIYAQLKQGKLNYIKKDKLMIEI